MLIQSIMMWSLLQSTQRGYFVFHITTADKVYLARTITEDSKRTDTVIVR